MWDKKCLSFELFIEIHRILQPALHRHNKFRENAQPKSVRVCRKCEDILTVNRNRKNDQYIQAVLFGNKFRELNNQSLCSHGSTIQNVPLKLYLLLFSQYYQNIWTAPSLEWTLTQKQLWNRDGQPYNPHLLYKNVWNHLPSVDVQ